MMKNMKFQTGLPALIGSIVIWASTFVITKSLMTSIGPMTVIGVRLVIALVVLLPLSLRTGFKWNMIFKKHFLFFGLSGIALYFGLSNVGLLLSTSGNAALIQAANPAAIALFSNLFLKEQISKQRATGIVLSIIGVLLVSGTPTGEGSATFIGNILMLGGVIAWAVYTVQSKKLPEVISPLTATTISFVTGLVWLLPFILLEIAFTGLPVIQPSAWVALVYLGIAASALAFFLWNFGLETVDASLAAPLINLIPIIGLFFSSLAGEQIVLNQILGGLIVIAGVLITQGIHPFQKGFFRENPDTPD